MQFYLVASTVSSFPWRRFLSQAPPINLAMFWMVRTSLHPDACNDYLCGADAFPVDYKMSQFPIPLGTKLQVRALSRRLRRHTAYLRLLRMGIGPAMAASFTPMAMR